MISHPSDPLTDRPLPQALAVIIGRAGSKGFPGKNTRLLAGLPVVLHSIRHARTARCVAHIRVSTDSRELANAARQAGVEVIDRPAHLATDTATVADAVRHAVGDHPAPVIVVLYANVPVRPDDLIDRAVDFLLRTGADSVQSYSPVGKSHPYWQVAIDADARIAPFIENSIDRRQDLPPLYLPDGGVIALQRHLLNAPSRDNPHAFLGSDRRAICNPEGSVVDIDSEHDFLLAQALIAGAAPTLRNVG